MGIESEIDIEFEKCCKSAEVIIDADAEEIQKLLEQLRQEEICCENCNNWKEYGLAGCDGCGTFRNKITFEELLA